VHPHSDEPYRALFDEAPVAYHEVGRDGSVVRVNRKECELLGLPRERILGRPVWSFVTPDLQDASRLAVYRKLHTNDPLSAFERDYVRGDGAIITLQVHENRILDSSGRTLGIRTALLDVTEQKRQEQSLHRQFEEMKRSNAELEQFAYVASHDLQEPLRMIGSYTQLLAKRYKGRLDTDADEFIGYAVGGAQRMQQLIADLLVYSRIGTKGGPFSPVDPQASIRTALTNLVTAIQESGASFEVGQLPMLQADRVQIGQLFQNLIGNAIKFRGEVPPRVRISAAEVGPHWQFAVQDNGIGLDTRHADRIFQVFQRLQIKKCDGTGIGLAICKKIVERHGGQIWVKSQPGAGATFFFTLHKNPGAIS
jgi:PAS domain S-box-containing protein